MLAAAGATASGSSESALIGAVVFFATLFVYNIQRLLRMKELNAGDSEHLLWIKEHRALIRIFAVSGFAGAAFIYIINLGMAGDFLLLAAGTLLCIFYALSLHPGLKSLRNIPFIKIYLIAGAWTFTSVIWPWFRMHETGGFPILPACSVFFFILAATIPFDIRDLSYDNPEKKTIPQLLNIKGAKITALLFLALSAVCLALISTDFFTTIWFYIAFPGMAALIIYSRAERGELYYSGLIDFWITAYAVLLFSV